jgi:hypothetical protein
MILHVVAERINVLLYQKVIPKVGELNLIIRNVLSVPLPIPLLKLNIVIFIAEKFRRSMGERT